MKTQTQLLIIAVAAGFLLSGCGANKVDSNPTSSGSTNQSSTDGALAKCSHDLDNLSDFSIRLKVYEDTNGSVRNDLIRVKFDRFPTGFSNNSDAAIELWSRTADSSGTWGSWHRLPFYVETTGGNRTSYAYTDLTWSQMSQIAAYFGMGSVDASTFFSQVRLLAQLSDTSVSKILTAKIYDGNSSPETTALIPTFEANPNQYAKTHSTALQAFHPLQSMAGSSYTEEQYEYEANQFCF